MEITVLPNDLNIKKNTTVQLFDYRIFDSAIRNKISLTKNTFSFLKEGVKEVIFNNQSTTIHNDHFLIMKSGNCLMTETISNQNQTYHSILLFFTNEMLLNCLEKYQFKSRNTKASNSIIVCEYDDYIKHFVTSLEQIYHLEKNFQETLLKAKFEEIMIYLIERNGIDFLNNLLTNQSDRTTQFKTVIEHNKHNKLTLQELAFLCNMSLSTFKREFNKHYEITPIKWFQQQRLEQAAFLLSKQNKRPIELFEAAGYDNFSNFVQAFKKQYGITPKQFQLKTN
jgi:AraC-like DNA-binding protein